MRRLWIAFAAVALLALVGCPKPKVSTTAEAPEAVSETTLAEQSTEATQEATAPEEQRSADAGAAGGSGDATHTPSTKELEGKWFALYGGTGLASKTFTHDNGHQIEFLPSGMAIWSVTGNGGSGNNGFQVASSWKMSTGEIEVAIEKKDDLNQPVENTPLAFGRDDEVGLTGSSVETGPTVFRFSPKLDGGFLALVGRRGELMVYGRNANNAPPTTPDVSGDWQLVSAPGQVDDVKVKIEGDQMLVEWGQFHNQFKGTYTNGYFVGMVTSTAGNAFAAVTPTTSGTLDGVISTEPYSVLQTTFDFTRAQ